MRTTSGSPNSFSYGYDALDRLTSVTPSGSTQLFGYTYDKVGNRLGSVTSGASTTYTYPTGSHRLSGLSGAQTLSYAYDANGNQTGAGSVTWAYGGNNRPISVTTASTTTFAINALGQRVRKATGSTATRFVYDEAGRLLGEYDDTGALIQETVWLDDLPVATIRPDGTGTALFYVHPDHLGSPRAVTRPSDNQLVWKWDNTEPFGSSVPDENPSGLGVFAFNLRFPGQYFDAETGKHYNYFRDYDPAIGRYMQSDPIGLRGGINTFAYTPDPLSYSDFLGLEPGNAYQRGYGLPMPDFNGEPGLEPVCVECIIPVLRFRLPPKPRGTQPGLPPAGVKPPVPEQCTVGPATRGDGKSLWDKSGGEWRYKPEDKWHNPHWDYNPWNSWNSSWQNVPINNRPPIK